MWYQKHLRWLIPVIGLAVTIVLLVQVEQQQDPFEPTPSYEVQMADELYYTDETIQQWVDEVCQEAGTYEQKIGAYQYLLLCGGEQSKDRSALALVDTVQTETNIQVVYALVEIENEEYNQNQKAPFMLVRIPNHLNLKLVAKQISEDDISTYLDKKVTN